MEQFGKPIGRRKFLKRGIACGFGIAVFPVWKTIHSSATQSESLSPNHEYSPDEPHRRLLKLMREYGGEFGGFRGGL
jgi:hypothetical protein